jgi:hypothetical protein
MNRTTRRAPARAGNLLVAALVAGLVAGTVAPVHAQTAPAQAEPAPAASAADDCLAKPNAPSPRGSHWHYHVDRATGRKCWYLRAQDAAAGEAEVAKPRTAAAPAPRSSAAAPAPALSPATSPALSPAPAPAAVAPAVPPAASVADAANDGQSVVPPIAPIASSPAAAWPSAAPRALEPPRVADSAAAVPAAPAVAPPGDARSDAPNSGINAAPPEVPAAPSTSAPVSEEPGHAPALLGMAFAVAVIILGFLAVRLIARWLRRPRPRALIDLPDDADWDAPMPVADWDASPPVAPPSPAIAAAMRPLRDARRPEPRRDDWADVIRDEEVRRYAPRRPPPPPPREAPEPSRADARMREEAHMKAAHAEDARMLEDDVRELLTKLRAELQERPQPPDRRVAAAGRPSRPAAPPLHASPVGSGDRAAALYAWRGRKR